MNDLENLRQNLSADIKAIVLLLGDASRQIVISNYQKHPQAGTISEALTARPFPNLPKLTFARHVDNYLTIGEQRNVSVRIQTLINGYDAIREGTVSQRWDEAANIFPAIDSVITVVNQLRNANVRPNIDRNRSATISLDPELETEVRERLGIFAESALPPSIRNASLESINIPELFRQQGSEILTGIELVDLFESADKLRFADNPEHAAQSYELRARILSSWLRYEALHEFDDDGLIKPISFAIGGALYEKRPGSGRLTSCIDNFITDTLFMLDSPKSMTQVLGAIFSRDYSTPGQIFALINRTIGMQQSAYLLGRAIAQRDPLEVDAVDTIEYLTNNKSGPSGLMGGLVNYAGRLISGRPAALDFNKLMLGFQEIGQRRIIAGKELSEKISLEVDDDAETVPIPIPEGQDTERLLQFNLRDLGVKIESGVKGKLLLVVSELEQTVEGRIMITEGNRRQNLYLPFKLVHPGSNPAIEIDLIDLRDTDNSTSSLVMQILKAALRKNGVEATRDTVQENVHDSASTSSDGMTARQRKLLSYVKSDRQQHEASGQALQQSSPLTSEQESLDLPELINMAQLKLDVKDGLTKQNHRQILKEIGRKLRTYSANIAITREMFGKDVRYAAEQGLDLRQITIRAGNGNLNLRLYFVPEAGGSYRYVGLLVKHSKSEQDVFIKQLVSQLGK